MIPAGSTVRPARFIRVVTIAPTDVVVDVGCGDGGAIKFCANQGADIATFLDVNEEKVKGRGPTAKINPRGSERHRRNRRQIDIANGIADRVICTEVLEHVDDPQTLMSEMARIGKSRALYLLTVPHEAGGKR